MSEIVIIYSVFPSAGEAHDCCRTLLNEGLIACANRLGPAISHYRWEGEQETAEEHPVMFKTRVELESQVIERIGQLHSYRVPAIVSWPASNAHPLFNQWVAAETSV
jgi:periplasmic divalent cation tolerance protein